MDNNFKRGFFKTLIILRDYLSDIVISGGWAPLIYYHYLLSKKDIEPLRTRDIDIVVPEKIKKRADKTIDELLIEAGLKSTFKSLHIPPAISYEGNIEGYEVEIEFLTHKRGAKEDSVIKVQKGLHAQSLRFISPLLENTIVVRIDDFMAPESEILKIRVPAPGAFIFNKGLTFTRRTKRAKKAKDLYYIFDILANCPELNKQITDELNSFKKSYPINWSRRFIRNLKNHFSAISAEGVYLVQNQRPEGTFPNMDDEQFSRFVLGIFQELISSL